MGLNVALALALLGRIPSLKIIVDLIFVLC